MVELTSIIAWASLIIIPSIILGFGSMVDSRKSSLLLAFTNFMALLGFFMYKGYVGDYWIILVTIAISLVTFGAYKSVLTGGSS